MRMHKQAAAGLCDLLSGQCYSEQDMRLAIKNGSLAILASDCETHPFLVLRLPATEENSRAISRHSNLAAQLGLLKFF